MKQFDGVKNWELICRQIDAESWVAYWKDIYTISKKNYYLYKLAEAKKALKEIDEEIIRRACEGGNDYDL